MGTARAGVGFDDRPDSFGAGERAATEAFEQMGETPGSLVMAFCTGRHDYQACFEGIRTQDRFHKPPQAVSHAVL